MAPVFALLLAATRLFAQTPTSLPDDQAPGKHLLWIIPNYRSSPSLAEYKPLTAKEKFTIAEQDTFDRGTVALAGLFAIQSQISNSNPSFGQGVKGFARNWATSYADYASGNTFTEGVFPALLHQDPRYFRRGTGSVLSRLVYAAGQTVLTHGDNGKTQFNFSEIAGNSASVALSMAYYPDNRNAKDAVVKLGTQIGVDMASNMLKELWVSGRKKSRQ